MGGQKQYFFATADSSVIVVSFFFCRKNRTLMTLVYHLYGRHFVTWSQEQAQITGILPLVDITSTNPSAVAPMNLAGHINLEIELNSNPDTAQIEIIQSCVIFKSPT